MQIKNVVRTLSLTAICLTACNPLDNSPHTDSSFLAGTPIIQPAPVQGADLAFVSAAVSSDGTFVVVETNFSTYAPLLPASGMTGFSVSVNGSVAPIASASRSGTSRLTLLLSTTIASTDVVTVTYSGGNVTDSSSLLDPLDNFGAVSATNNAAFDSDALAYFGAVATNGGTISSSTKTATQTLITSLKTSGVWSKLVEIYPFAGDQLASALTKLKTKNGGSSLLSNSNFVAGDYSETGATGGLKGNASNKLVDTGVSVPSLGRTDISIGAYVNLDSSNAHAFGCYIGSSYNATGDNDRFYMIGGGTDPGTVGQAGLGNHYPPGKVNGTGFRVMTYDGTTYSAYKNSVQYSEAAAGVTWQQLGTVTIFNGAGNFYFDGRLAFAFVGQALTPTDVTNFNNAVQTFETTLGRNI